MRPVPSCRSAKSMPPWPRFTIRRPATVTGPASGAASSSASASATVWVRWKCAANGSMPSAASRSSFCRRSRKTAGRSRCSWSVTVAAKGTVGSPVAAGRPLLDRADRDPADAAGGGPLDLLAGPVAHQRLAQRALVGDAAAQRVGLRRAHDGVRLLAVLGVHGDTGADRDHARLPGRVLDQPRVADHGLQRLDPALDEALLVLRLRVFGILRDVAELAGLADTLGDLVPAHPDQLVELLLQPVQTILREQNRSLVHHRSRDSITDP